MDRRRCQELGGNRHAVHSTPAQWRKLRTPFWHNFRATCWARSTIRAARPSSKRAGDRTANAALVTLLVSAAQATAPVLRSDQSSPGAHGQGFGGGNNASKNFASTVSPVTVYFKVALEHVEQTCPTLCMIRGAHSFWARMSRRAQRSPMPPCSWRVPRVPRSDRVEPDVGRRISRPRKFFDPMQGHGCAAARLSRSQPSICFCVNRGRAEHGSNWLGLIDEAQI